MTIEKLKNDSNYYVHHTSSRLGYVSRKGSGIVEKYSGRYGEGYVHIQPRWDTSRYVFVTYYIRKK